MDISAVQTVDKPTRDVLVVYDQDNDRQFVGFGGPNDSFADCFISAEKLPLDSLRSCVAVVTGTLGLAFPATAEAMHKAVETARTGSAVVRMHDALLLIGACNTLMNSCLRCLPWLLEMGASLKAYTSEDPLAFDAHAFLRPLT